MALLHKRGLTTYETPGGIIVSLSKEEKIKVKKKKAPKDDVSDDADFDIED